MGMSWRGCIVSTPGILGGKPRVEGTRIPVSLVLAYLAEGCLPATILQEYPDLSREHIAACLDDARELTDRPVADDGTPPVEGIAASASGAASGNRTRLGSGRATGRILGDVTEPLVPAHDERG